MTSTRTTPEPTRSRRLRRPALTGLAVAAVALLLGACLNADQQSALDAMNRDRTANRRGALTINDQAQAKAQKWAEKIARDNRLSHSNLASGISCYRALGENVGYASSVAAAQRAFMASADHKKNILDTRWNGAGIGVAKNGSRVFVVQVFIAGC